MWPNPQFSADLVTFTKEILNGKLHFLYRASCFEAFRICLQETQVFLEYSVAVTWRCSVKKLFLKFISSFIVKHLCESIFFNNVAGRRPVTY